MTTPPDPLEQIRELKAQVNDLAQAIVAVERNLAASADDTLAEEETPATRRAQRRWGVPVAFIAASIGSGYRWVQQHRAFVGSVATVLGLGVGGWLLLPWDGDDRAGPLPDVTPSVTRDATPTASPSQTPTATTTVTRSATPTGTATVVPAPRQTTTEPEEDVSARVMPPDVEETPDDDRQRDDEEPPGEEPDDDPTDPPADGGDDDQDGPDDNGDEVRRRCLVDLDVDLRPLTRAEVELLCSTAR